MFGLEAKECGDGGWGEGVCSQDHGTEDGPNSGIILRVVGTEGLLKDRSVKRVECCISLEPRPAFEYTALLGLQETIQLHLWTVVPFPNEPNCGHSVKKQPSCAFAKDVHLFLGRPVIQPTSIALEF